MEPVNRRVHAFTVAVLLFIVIGALLIVALQTKESLRSTHDPFHNDKRLTYSFSKNTPPKLKADLLEYFKENGYEENTIDTKDSTVNIYKTDTSIPVVNSLNLYQIWVLAEKFKDSFDTTSVSTIGIHEKVDVSDPHTEIADSFHELKNLVSLETSSNVSKVILVPIELLNIGVYTPLTTLSNFEFSPKPSKWSEKSYPLVSHIVIDAPENVLEDMKSNLLTDTYLLEHYYRSSLPTDNDFVTVIKTGTTVAGGPGWELCERTRGSMSYPIDRVKNVLSAADITIISNESSFIEGCSQAAGTTAFCGKPSYLQNLIEMGTDIISLTGNHMCDYGKTVFSETLDMYTANNMGYFGGGKKSSEAWTPLYVDTGAGRIAFIGVNLMGPTGVIADEESSGVAYYDDELFSQTLTKARVNADIVWVDTHLWPEYGTTPGADQIAVSEKAASLGASIITGVSSHELQGMTFIGPTPVFYGLGNFLFDQMWSMETRQGLVLEVTLFENKIINITLMPTILYDYCQPRFAEAEEKTRLLNYFKQISTFPE